METDDHIEDHDDSVPDYRPPGEIGINELSGALCSLNLLSDDVYLRMQAVNLSIVDQFIMHLEYETLRQLFDEEKTPDGAHFLSAQSQMWIFAAYELLRTWRQRAKDVLKLATNGGLPLKIKALEKELGYFHPGRELRALQLRRVADDPTAIDKIKADLKITHMPFISLEHIRVAIAKHEIRQKEKSIAYMPGYGRINRWCGSLEYEVGGGGAVWGNSSRRDVAESLRAIADLSKIPTDEEIVLFDEYMKGPPGV